MFKVRWLAFGLLVAFVVALASTTASEVGQAQGERIYRMGMLSDLRTTNTMRVTRTATVWESYVLGPRHCSLFTQTPTRFYYVPSLAAAVPFRPGTAELDLKSEAGLLTLTVDLKRGVKWSDGSDVTADDVVFSAFEAPTIFGGGDFAKGVTALGGGWTFSLDPSVLAKVEKLDSHKVKYSFKGFSLRIQFAALFHAIFQKKYWEPRFRDSVGNREKLEGLTADDEPACGWAAFPESLRVAGKGWERGAFATNVANPNYFWKGIRVDERNAAGKYTESRATPPHSYEQDVPAAAGPELARYEIGPFVDRAAYRIFGDTASAVAALVRGDIELLLNPLGADPGIRAQYRTEPRVRTADNKSHGMFYMAMNFRRKPFGSGPLQRDARFRDDDIIGSRFRSSVNCLVDRQFVTETLFQRVAFPLFSVVSPANSFWFNDKVTAPCAEFTELTDPRGARAKKLDAAVKILQSVGFTWVRPPRADVATGAVTAGEGLINPVILGSADAAAGAAVAVPAGTIAVGAKVPLGTRATLTAGAATAESDGAGKMSLALPTGTASVTLSAAGKVYFYRAGAAADRVPTFNFIYPNSAYDPRRALFGVQVEKWANQAGIPVRGVPTGFNVIVTKIFDEQDFDWWSLGWSLGTAALGAPTYLKDFYHTEFTNVGDDNAQGYSNPEVDKLLDAFLAERDLSKARAIVLQLQEVLAVDAPYLTWFDTVIVDAWRDDRVVFPFTERTNGLVGMAGAPALVRLR
ncbi:ABC transporter substrate-binding protein [Candidatus Acetothermia bacterium]|jgi:ABC-type transport system substrate-binding protein|nr:ABC transporter substrate-binding protein [Candidatus Acetothermia bacterium]MCI2437060.1 ABC transporter substrate-binding protein [Candidatus Acetothermia bacterium]